MLLNMMVRWVTTADAQLAGLLDLLRLQPKNMRSSDPRAIELLAELREKWRRGYKLERQAAQEWTEENAWQTFNHILDNLDGIRAEYKEYVKKYGLPPRLR